MPSINSDDGNRGTSLGRGGERAFARIDGIVAGVMRPLFLSAPIKKHARHYPNTGK